MRDKKISRKNNLLSHIVLFFTIFSITLIICLSFSLKSAEAKGINTEPLNISFNAYIINDEINEDALIDYIQKADKIWNNYNISILVKNISHVNINITDDERDFLFNADFKDNNESYNKKQCKKYIPILKKITPNSNKSIIFMDSSENPPNPNAAGRGNICGNSLVIFREEKFLWKDFTGGNLAHEIGHILNLSDFKDTSKKHNLMNRRSKTKHCYLIFPFKEYFLNQTQINNAVKTIKEKFQPPTSPS